MKVLMTADTLGGVLSYSLELGAFLRSRGVRVVLATLGQKLDSAASARITALGLELEQSEYRLEWMDEPWQDVERSGQWLLGLERRYRPDVVHLCSYAHAALPFAAPTVLVAHSCVLSWWRAVLAEPAPERYERYRREVKTGLSRAGCVVAPTRAMLSALEQEYGPVPNACVIPNGVALVSGRDCEKEPLVLCAGRVWDRAKNIQLVAQVARDVPWPCHVAGERSAPDGHEMDHLEGLVPLGALSQPKLADWMARAAIFVSPTLYEPFGLSILEAARAGCALVLGDIPSLRELWSGAACFVSPRSASALRAALLHLIAAPAERAELAGRARERAARYGIERSGSRYLELYQGRIARNFGVSSMEAQA